MTAEQERYFKSFLDHMFDHMTWIWRRGPADRGWGRMTSPCGELHVLDAVGRAGWRTAATP